MNQEKRVPKRRLRTFSETSAWDEKRFGEIAERNSAVMTSGELPSIEYEDLASGRGELNKDIWSKDAKKAGILFSEGDVLYGKLRPYLRNWYLPKFDGVAVGDFWVLHPREMDASFLYELIQTNRYEDAANQSTGTKMPRADWNVVADTAFYVPVNQQEQKTIGTFLRCLDQLITFHERKLQKLEHLKQAYLSEMFPAKGERQPQRRFKGFSGDWDVDVLGSLVDEFYNGQTPYRNEPSYWRGQIPWLSSGELNHGIITATKEHISEKGRADYHLRILPKGTFVIAVMGLEAVGVRGNCAILGIESTINQACMAILPKSGVDVQFLKQWYEYIGNESGLKFTQGTKQQNYNAEILNGLEMMFPSLSEQKKIGRFLAQMDHMIFQQKHYEEKLRALKQAYLSELFV